jgi:predicted DNA-binding transcriptional regulator AlpA
MEQILYSLPIEKMEPLIKGWIRDVLDEKHINTPEGFPGEIPFGIEEFCRITGYAKATIYGKNFRHEIPAHRHGKSGKLFFFPSEVDEWLKSGKLHVGLPEFSI